MVAFLRTFLAVVLAIVVLACAPILLGLLIMVFSDTGPKEGSWLTIHLSGPLLEHYGPATLRDFFEDPPPCLMEITENLEKAAVDERIAGVLFRIEDFAAGQGKLDEIQAGVRRVREAGKPVHVYGPYLTDAGVYLASGCDSTFLFPKGRVFLLGRGAALQHLKGTLEKLDIHDQFHAIGEYKSAVELFTTDKSSPETIENLRWVLQDLVAAYDDTVAARLSLPVAELERMREKAILTAEEAIEAGVVDEAIYWDQLEERLKGFEQEWRHISSADYAKVDRKSLHLTGKTRVAVVHAQGFVASGGDDRYDPVLGLTLGPDRVIEDLRSAWEDDDVKAIILRWDTGGGATDGSQRIARAVARARDEKPVVVSIADQAASGGYMMSYPANHIVCAANGITGSIGSITGKFNLRGLWEKLGVTFDELALAPHVFLFSALHDFTDEQWERIADDNWEMYNGWVADIARARGLTFQEVDDAARGRVWTGRQARERHLVDDLGGFEEALAKARRLADLEEDEKVSLRHYPERRTVLELILSGDFVTAFRGEVLREAWRALRSARWSPPGSYHYEPFRAE